MPAITSVVTSQSYDGPGANGVSLWCIMQFTFCAHAYCNVLYNQQQLNPRFSIWHPVMVHISPMPISDANHKAANICNSKHSHHWATPHTKEINMEMRKSDRQKENGRHLRMGIILTYWKQQYPRWTRWDFVLAVNLKETSPNLKCENNVKKMYFTKCF